VRERRLASVGTGVDRVTSTPSDVSLPTVQAKPTSVADASDLNDHEGLIQEDEAVWPSRSCAGVSPTDATPKGDPWASDIAAWHLQSASTSDDPRIAAAYRQLQQQTDCLFRVLTDHSRPHCIRVSFTFVRRPYDSDQELIAAIVNERRLEVTVASSDQNRLHPALDCCPGGPYDRFRAVHDIVGHGFGLRGFDAEGEYSAWQFHNDLCSGLAQLALATELRGEYAVLTQTGECAEHKALIFPPALVLRENEEVQGVKGVRRSSTGRGRPDGSPFSGKGGPSTRPAALMTRTS
jgi:hypothetical protein